ncbi:hypothetical protein [Janthinobacterium sp. HLX7-2]|uniref:hypothetical protein n=1 Tax=Janthinobacterium sp. HLX7-2 TaxID=1259331 RepID=UPI003F2254C2
MSKSFPINPDGLQGGLQLAGAQAAEVSMHLQQGEQHGHRRPYAGRTDTQQAPKRAWAFMIAVLLSQAISV